MAYLPFTPDLSRLAAGMAEAGFEVEIAVRVGSEAVGWADVLPGSVDAVPPPLAPTPAPGDAIAQRRAAIARARETHPSKGMT